VPLDAPLLESIPGDRLHANGTYAVYCLRPAAAAASPAAR